MKTNPVPGTDHLVSAQFPSLGEPFQPLLWIPEHTGNRTAFCSLNIRRHPDYTDMIGKHPFSSMPPDIYSLMGYDDNGCSRCAPFEAWENPNCGTGYTIIPIQRTLTGEELADLGQALADHLGKPAGHYDSPIRAFRSDRMKEIVEVLESRDHLLGTMIAPNWLAESCNFHIGQCVTHHTEDGDEFPGIIKSFRDGQIEITWPNGITGIVQPETCHPG